MRSRGRSCSRARRRRAVTQVGTDGSPEKVQNAIQAAPETARTRSSSTPPTCRPGPRRRAFSSCRARWPRGSDRRRSTPAPAAACPDILASKVVAQSGGKADTVYVNVVLAAVGTEFEKKYKELCPACKSAEDRHPADLARQGRSWAPHCLLPCAIPSATSCCRSPARSAPASAPRRRSEHQGEDHLRPGLWQPADLPGRQVRPGVTPSSLTATTTRCSTRSRASGRGWPHLRRRRSWPRCPPWRAPGRHQRRGGTARHRLPDPVGQALGQVARRGQRRVAPERCRGGTRLIGASAQSHPREQAGAPATPAHRGQAVGVRAGAAVVLTRTRMGSLPSASPIPSGSSAGMPGAG